MRLGKIAVGIGFLIPFLFTSTWAGDRDPISIAAIYALSGPAMETDITSLRGARRAVEEINRSEGVLGRPLALVELDNRSTPIGSKVAADAAVSLGVSAIVGCAWSSHSLAAARVAQAAGIPMVSNVSTHPDLTRVGDYIFRVCFNDLYQGRIMAQFAVNRLGLKRAVLCVDINSHYSLGLAEAFAAHFRSRGGTVLQTLEYRYRQPNFRETVAHAQRLQPDALFIPGHDESALIVREAEERGMKAVPLGGDGWDTESFFSKGGDEISLAYFSTNWSPVLQTAASRKYVAGSGTSETLHTSAALAYDAVFLLADAIRRAGSEDPRSVRDALADTRDFEGVTGNLTFNDQGDPVKGAVIMKIENGRAVFLEMVGPDAGKP